MRKVEGWFPRGTWILVAALCAEAVIFAVLAPNFLTPQNFFEIIRVSVELGLLAIALTPVIVSGGIDLSVGSVMGLSAVIFRAASREVSLAIGGAALP